MIHTPVDHNSENHIYVLLTDTGTLFTKMIKVFTSAPYNHASLALDERLGELFSFGRKRPDNPWIAGFIEERVVSGTYGHFPDTRCALLRLRVTSLQRAAIIQLLRDFMEEKETYRYNLLGLLGVLFRRELAPRNAYFCSQFVAEVLRGAGRPLWTRPSALVTPNDFLHHSAFELMYEGLLQHYPLLGRDDADRELVPDMPAPDYLVNEQAV